MQERSYESGSCVQKNCAILGVHPKKFSPSSVQFKGEMNDAVPPKRHQQRHLEFCTAYLLSRGSGVRISPGAPFLSTTCARSGHLLFRQMAWPANRSLAFNFSLRFKKFHHFDV